jgi:Short C-terminal domain
MTMLIRPPVVREMRRDLWMKMTKTPDSPSQAPENIPSSSDPGTRITQLRALGELRASGVLTEDEFIREKARILA